MAAYTLESIDKELIKSDEVVDLESPFVAIAVQVDSSGDATHAGLVINCDEGYFLFHLSISVVDLEETPDNQWFFHKIFPFIEKEFCNKFYGHCKNVSNNAQPRFAYFFPDAYYDPEGNYYADNPKIEYMTCVGFCINVIKMFVEADEYFQYSDWGIDTVPNYEFYVERFLAQLRVLNPNITIDDIAADIRRISPAEYLASAYLEQLPITRENIDAILELVVDSIRLKRPIPPPAAVAESVSAAE